MHPTFDRLITAALITLGLTSAVHAAVRNAPGPPTIHKAVSQPPEFPEPDALKPAVAFWMRVYLETTTRGGLLHDSDHLGVVYERIHFPKNATSRARQKHIDRRRQYWRRVLRALATHRTPRDTDEKTAFRLLSAELGSPPTPARLRQAARRIRFQLGQRDKFRQGIIRSGAYESAMRAVFREEGLPEDLATLPHVESSFNIRAYSKYGAAGVWQFMRSTGRRFLRIDYIVDQRLDPITATRAAARLLKENRETLGNWPLAITAYNHGVGGLRRAKRVLGTDDLVSIIQKYRSRTFGFASRNFYAQFLAARKVVRSYKSHFGPLEREDPETVDEVTLPYFVNVKEFAKYLGVAAEVVQHYNPALRPPVFRAGKRIPKGYVLRLPAGTVQPDAKHWLAKLPASARHARQHRSRYYAVRRGDTLSRIAARQHTTVATLVALNQLPSRHRIFPGQTLQLPQGNRSRTRSKRKQGFELVRSAEAAPRSETPPPPKVEPVTEPPVPMSDDSPFRRIQKNHVQVDASETLGHFADWLEIPTRRLRRLNHMSPKRKLRFGQRLELDFSRVRPEDFLQRRIEFHKGLEEDFFGTYRVTGTIEHELRPGDNLWVLAHRVYRVPVWLIRSFNRERDLTKLIPGKTLKIPRVEPIGG